MQMLMMLAPIIGLVGFVAYIWLVVVAFKESAGWGLLVLFLSPITAIVFAIKFWQESKRPFLVYMGSGVASLGILVAMFSAMGGFAMMSMAQQMNQGDVSEEQVAVMIEQTMDKWEDSGLLDEEEQQQLDVMRQELHNLREEAEHETAPPPVEVPSIQADPDPAARQLRVVPPKAEPQAEAPPVRSGRISVKAATGHVGEFVRAVTRDEREHIGRIVRADGNSILLETHLSAGTFSYELTAREIDTLDLLRP